jgi:hypothetical protein
MRCIFSFLIECAKIVEVKGPRDRLSDQQICWIECIQNCGIEVCVLRVSKRGDEIGAENMDEEDALKLKTEDNDDQEEDCNHDNVGEGEGEGEGEDRRENDPKQSRKEGRKRTESPKKSQERSGKRRKR